MPHLPVRHRSYGAPTAARRRGNPYFLDRRSDHIGSSWIKSALAKLPPRFWFWLFLLVLLAAILLWVIGWSGALTIKNIEVRETVLIPRASVEDIARERLDDKRIFVLPESSLIFYNSNALSTEIQARYPLDGLKIVKRLPATLIITIQEKKAVAVWFEADSYYEVDKQGWVLSVTDGSVEALPTIYNNGQAALHGKRLEGKDQAIAFVSELDPAFKQRFGDIYIKQTVVDEEANTVKIVPQKGAFIYFADNQSVNSQLERLALLLQSELKGKFEKISYIDLRFGDRVYYK